ncbi:MAG TPA: glycoside hydrolase family 43 protein, partial [Candidatus Limnocylindria bacterium]|nr:glycoside hydrolase family 43 protein [Candidatus Limnocylindria bacterium]
MNGRFGWRVPIVGAVLAISAAACQADGGGGSPAATGTPAAETFTNPVLDRNFPDPGVLALDGTYYAYATNDGAGTHIQGATSTDLVEWEYLGEMLTTLPSWTTQGTTWAPEVIELGGQYVMHYTARDPALTRPDGQGSQCLAVAVAAEPQGPFTPHGDGPFACQPELGGSIDSFPFVDEDGTPYLIWKNDGNCCGMPTRMWGQELAPDGLSLVGEPVDLGISNDQAWEGGVIEAPTILLRDGTYYLFYSGNAYSGPDYAVGYATSDALLGPYTDAEENPILATPEEPADTNAIGPGHQAIVEDPDGDLWMLYHSWDVAGGFTDRTMWIDELVFEDG